ncbi:hypothetical protein DSTSK_14020 [Desulforhabdus sp. TSK]|nr:hypothetical protein DSTSK_14020 [Desulforhabdus sp. TSK]
MFRRTLQLLHATQMLMAPTNKPTKTRDNIFQISLLRDSVVAEIPFAPFTSVGRGRIALVLPACFKPESIHTLLWIPA